MECLNKNNINIDEEMYDSKMKDIRVRKIKHSYIIKNTLLIAGLVFAFVLLITLLLIL